MRSLAEPVDYVARVDWAHLVLLCAGLGSPGSEVARAMGVHPDLVAGAVAPRGGQGHPRECRALRYDELERLTAWVQVLWRSARESVGERVDDWTQVLMCAVACGVPRELVASRLTTPPLELGSERRGKTRQKFVSETRKRPL